MARRGSLPDSPYGISKKAAEGYLAYYQRARGTDFTALALANVYGPRQDPFGEGGVIAIFGAAMLDGGRPVIFGDGEQTRDYVFVDDVVHAFALASDKASGALLNVGTGVETSVNELARQLGELSGFRGAPSFGPARPGEVLRSSLDAGLAGRRLGWKPWTTLPEGLKATVDWLRAGSSARG